MGMEVKKELELEFRIEIGIGKGKAHTHTHKRNAASNTYRNNEHRVLHSRSTKTLILTFYKFQAIARGSQLVGGI